MSPYPKLTAASRGPYVPAVPNDDAITLHGMRFHTRIGILPHEGDLPQPLEVDLTVWLAGRPAPRGATLDYRELYAMVAEVVSGHLHYLEEVASGVAERALAMRAVGRVRVAVRKPHVALPGPLSYAEVVVDRSRRE